MKILSSRIVWGSLLILGGLLLLLENLTDIKFSGLIIPVLFGFAGLAFLSTFLQNRANWWAIIPGVVLLGLAGLIAIDELNLSFPEILGGFLFLGSISLAFWLVYFANRNNWWAVIPAGVMLTLALMPILGEQLASELQGGIFFFGIGLTFVLLGLLSNQTVNLRWAFIPAGIMLVMGILLSTAAIGLFNYLWPVLLILAGLFLLIRNFYFPRES